MPRYVDSLPPPAKATGLRVVVVSYCRDGTLGLYAALKILGYKPCHVVNIFEHGVPHIETTIEAIKAGQTGVGRYSRADFDKWFDGYDSVIEIPSFDLLDEFLIVYPDAMFILTTREPEAWLASMKNTIIPANTVHQYFPLSILKYFDTMMWSRSRLAKTWRYCFFPTGDLQNHKSTADTYVAYNQRVRDSVQAEKLLEVKLEDGLGWEQICPFLKAPIPDMPYPRIHDSEDFLKRFQESTNKDKHRAIGNVVSVSAAMAAGVAVGLWLIRRSLSR
ncbi:hypothetical protein GGR57DRAFT_517775 [Xylariaceae sp. FL1272]|nr:hypothetical protein GGR57DRAFT_517775 [Xylariaceae sp. FL1272]